MKALFAFGLFVALTIPPGLCTTSLGPQLNMKTRTELVEEIEPPNLEDLAIGHKIELGNGRIFAKVEVAKLVEEKTNALEKELLLEKVEQLKNTLENMTENINETEIVNEIALEIVNEEVDANPDILAQVLVEVSAHPAFTERVNEIVSAIADPDIGALVQAIAKVKAPMDMGEIAEVKAKVNEIVSAHPAFTALEIVKAHWDLTALALEFAAAEPDIGEKVNELAKEIVLEDPDIKAKVQARVNAHQDSPLQVQANSLEYTLVDMNGSKDVLVKVQMLVDAKSKPKLKELAEVKELENVLGLVIANMKDEKEEKLQSSGLTGGSRYFAGMTGVTVISVILVIFVIAALNWQSQRRKSGYFADARRLQKQRKM